MTVAFEKTLKLKFSNAVDPQYIQFGNVRDNDPRYNIRSGRLKIPG